MNQPQAIHPHLLSKDLEGVTQTNTYTEKPYSYFDPTQEQVIQHNVDQKAHAINEPKKFQHGQKTLTKVKSMPLTLYNPLRDGYHAKSGDNLEIKKPQNMRETANRLTKDQKNTQFANFSPIPNKAKSYDMNRSFNTNLESKEYIVHDFTINRTPKVNNYEKFNIKGSSGYIDPVTFESSFQEKSKQNLSPVHQERQITINQSQAKNWSTFKVPVPNVRIPSNEKQTEVIHSPFTRNVSLPPTFQAKRPQVLFQKPQSVTYNSQQVIKSNISGLDRRVQLQSIVYDSANQSQISNLNSKREKISFAKIPQNTQRLEEAEFQRPQFRKIYDNKDETFRMVGPQEDYFRQQKTTCSKILPILGVIIFLLLLAGTLFGLGVMTGMIGSRNYLSGNEQNLIEREKTLITGDNVYVSNEIETGGNELTRESEVEDEVVAPSVAPVVIEKDQQQIPKQEQKQVTKQGEVSTVTQTIVPQTINSAEALPSTVVIPTPISTPIIQQSQTKPTEVIIPVPTLEPVQSEKQSTPQIIDSIEPQIIILPPQPAQQIKPETINTVIQPQKSEQIQPTTVSTVQVTQEQPSTQPQKTTQQLTQQLFQPQSQPIIIPSQQKSTQIKPQTSTQSPTPAQIIPITSPSEIKNEELKPFVPETQPIKTQPIITAQQAGKIVDVIIEENHQIIPVNVKKSFKQEILNEFEQVPINFRDVPHVEKISYQHLQQIIKSDPSHKATLKSINYRHHEVQKI